MWVPYERPYYKAIHDTASPFLTYRAMRILAEGIERDLLKCETKEQVRKKVKEFERAMRSLSQRASKRMARFSAEVVDETMARGTRDAERADDEGE